MTNPLKLSMDGIPIFLAVFGNEQKCSTKRLVLLLVDLLMTDQLGKWHNSIASDAELFRLDWIFVCLFVHRAEELLDHLVELFKDIQDQKVQIAQQCLHLVMLSDQV